MKAYKATDKNMQCRGFQFELNKEFIQDGKIKMCFNGFHFCKRLKNIFKYYEFYPQNRFFEVEIPDDAKIIHGDDKSVTNKINFIRELSSKEIKELTNSDYYINEDSAYVKCERTTFYNEHGQIHREDGPAMILANGDQAWYQNGLRHRVDGPAVIWANGTQEWLQYDKRHRVGGPAVICSGGHQEWWQNGKLHRGDGPAITGANNSQAWYQNGKRHREDGPAINDVDGHQEFWINGVQQK